jgi:hypothetical protein
MMMMMKMMMIVAFRCASDYTSFYYDTRIKCERNKKIFWEDIQRKISVYFASRNLTEFLFESFMDVLNHTVQMTSIGEEFLPSSSPIIKSLLRQISLSYYGNFHTKRMDELFTLLPNEIWRTCPVPSNFSILRKINQPVKERKGLLPSPSP